MKKLEEEGAAAAAKKKSALKVGLLVGGALGGVGLLALGVALVVAVATIDILAGEDVVSLTPYN